MAVDQQIAILTDSSDDGRRILHFDVARFFSGNDADRQGVQFSRAFRVIESDDQKLAKTIARKIDEI